MTENKVGKVTHFFGKISVAIVELTDGDLMVGDTVHIKGHTTDLTQKVESMQIEHKNVEKAAKGQSIGLKVSARVHEDDIVYKVIE
jgi:putative protease|uniref:Translation elongation factor-like protein n=1 Tax=candidate division WOR-3 bacterium TaxID=2052148 RepID=A0A7C6EBD5_UNCW3